MCTQSPGSEVGGDSACSQLSVYVAPSFLSPGAFAIVPPPMSSPIFGKRKFSVFVSNFKGKQIRFDAIFNHFKRSV